MQSFPYKRVFRYNNNLYFKLTTFSHPSTSFARSSASGVLSPSEQNLKKDTHGKLFSMLKQNSAVLKTYQNYDLVGDICFSRFKLWYTYWSITDAISKFKPQSYVLYYQKRPCIYKSCTTYLKFLLNYTLLLKSYFKLVFGLKTYFCYSTLGGETRNCSWNRISNKICMAAIHLAQVKYSLNTRFFSTNFSTDTRCGQPLNSKLFVF